MPVARAIASLYRLQRQPLRVRVVVLFHSMLGLGYIPVWLFTMLQGNVWRADLSGFYTGWYLVATGQGARLYDFALQTSVQQALLEGRSFAGGLLRFVYPPHTAAAFAPLALLPIDTAFWVWSLLQFGMLAWLLAMLHQMARDWAPHERWLLISGVIAFPPLLYGFILGAFSLWMLLAVLLFSRAIGQQRDAWAGAWLALGTFKPQAVILPGVLLLGARRWRGLAGGAAVGGLFFVLSSVLLGWHIWLDFLRIVLATGVSSYPDQMYNLKGLLSVWAGAEHAPLISRISLFGLVGSALGTLWLWRGPWHPQAPDFAPRLALTIVLGLFFSPHLYPHDSLVLVAPAILFYGYLREQRPAHLRAYAIFLLICPLLFLVSRFAIGTSLGVRPPLLAMFILTGWIGYELWRQRQGGGAVPTDPAATAQRREG